MAAATWKPIWLFLAAVVVMNCLIPYASAHGGGDDDDDDSDSGGDGGHYNLRSKTLVVVKTWCLILVFAGTFLGGLSPYFYRWNETFLLLGTQFAGGVFLGTALMHFLSDSTETFGELTDKEYPFSFMLATAGYLITMLGDCIILWLYQRQDTVVNGDMETGDSAQKGTLGCHRASPHANVQVERQKANSNMGGGVHDNKINASLIVTTSLGDSLLLILALCFHSVFEGIAIGVAKDKADAWKALWTVCLHKIFAAIAMGIALLRMIPNRPFLSCAAYAFAFAISSPVGVAIGIIIDATTEGPVADWIYAISMGLACGIFVYVAINHLLAKGFTPHTPNPFDKPFYKFLAVLLGAGLIAVVMIWDT